MRRVSLQGPEYTKLRTAVLQRDGWKCRVCKTRSGLHVHHIIFKSQGGGDLSSNLVTLCTLCHKSVHGLIANNFLEIISHTGDEAIVPDADKGLKFKRYRSVRRRTTWNTHP